jgi:hypothetical protein
MSLPLELDRQLATLETQLPALFADKPDAGDFWAGFAGEADLIEDQADEHAAIVAERIASRGT